MSALLPKIELRQDPSIPGEWLNMRVRIDVTASGATHSYTCTGPKGAWGQPALTDAEHDVKLRDCLGRRLRPSTADEALGLLGRLEELLAPDISRLCQLISKSDLE